MTKSDQIIQLTDDIRRLRLALADTGRVIKGMIEKPEWYSEKDLHRLVKIIGDALSR